MDLTSFATSLITSFLIFLLLVCAFSCLSRRPGNWVIYYPSRILKGLDPLEGRKSKGPFAWIREAWQATQDEIISQAGLDAAVYLAFLTSAMAIMVLSAALCLPLLIPLSVTDHNIELEMKKKQKNAPKYDDFDKLAMGNIQPKTERLWAFFVAVYWISLVTYFVLWKTYKHVLTLRAREQASLEAKPEQFVVLVRDIPPVPPGKTRREQVDTFFRRLHPETFEKSLIVTDISKADKVWTELEGYRNKLAHAEAVFAESKTGNNPEGIRPMHRAGFLGLVGSKVDSIDFYNEKIKDITAKLETIRKVTMKEKQLAAAFIFFNSRPAALSAAQVVHSQVTDTWTVMPAPEPRQVLWKNLAIPFYQRMIRESIVYTIVFLTVVFYMIPIAAISAFTTLESLRRLLPFLKGIVNQKEAKSILEAYLPQLALILFLAFLPTFLMMLSKAEGIPSQSHAERASSGKYFYFAVFNVFLGVTIGGTLFQSIKEIEKKPNSIVSLLGTSLPPNASFFITFVALKCFVGYGLELCRVVPLIIYHLKRRFFCKTEEELRQAWAPGAFVYASRVPNDMLIITIVLCYSAIAPVILPFGILYFGLGWIVLRNQALKVYVPSYESNGRMWPHIQARILAALIICQVTMMGYLGIKKFVYASLIFPLPFATLVFGYICRKKFYTCFVVTSLEVACKDVKEAPSLPSIVEAYTPTCLLTEEKFEDLEQYEDARSEVSSRTASLSTIPHV